MRIYYKTFISKLSTLEIEKKIARYVNTYNRDRNMVWRLLSNNIQHKTLAIINVENSTRRVFRLFQTRN